MEEEQGSRLTDASFVRCATTEDEEKKKKKEEGRE